MTACPYCHQEIEAPSSIVQVNSETVIDTYDIWLGKQQGAGILRLTEKIPVITIGSPSTRVVQSPENRRYAASSLRDPLVK